MTEWYERHIIAIQHRSETGDISDWKAAQGVDITPFDARKSMEAGKIILCQAREERRNVLLAIPRKTPARPDPVGAMRAGHVR